MNEIIKNVQQQGMTIEQLKHSDALIRICLIILTVINSQEAFKELSECWNNELRSAGNDSKESKEEWYEVSEAALKLWSECNCEQEDLVIQQTEYEKNILYALRDKNILNNALDYLRKCVKDFKAVYKQQDVNIKEIQDLYATFSKDSELSAEQQILKMVTFIDQYRKQLEFDWKSYVEID